MAVELTAPQREQTRARHPNESGYVERHEEFGHIARFPRVRDRAAAARVAALIAPLLEEGKPHLRRSTAVS